MMTLYEKLAHIKDTAGTQKDIERTAAELNFAAYMSSAKGHCYDEIIEKAADLLLEAEKKDGAFTACAALEAEKLLLPLEKEAKKYRVHLVSHAHIDMNWMWGYDETAAVTADTFRTMLDLMSRYPEFTFSQSQASTYRIVADYMPEMLKEIRKRIKEGRWEVSASTWVENDENMPDGEALVRQLLYTKRYLPELLGISPEEQDLDFQPDTFGHNLALPEIMNAGGVKYFYHCRGNDGSVSAYRWRGRSGKELLCWCDPFWYSGSIEPGMFDRVPDICEKYGINCYLSVYGVGDHGGGPTAEDIRRILEIRNWRVMPTLIFSTYKAFYKELETFSEHLPVKEGECNFVFSGCYSSHSETKRMNRIGEVRLKEGEYLSALANALVGKKPDTAIYEKAWREILFGQFHDILPGSGVRETSEYAAGAYQNAMAAVRCRANDALRTFAEKIDTSALHIEDDGEASAGAGFAAGQGAGCELSATGQQGGKRRAFHLFNTSGVDRRGAVKIPVWNWDYDLSRAVFTDLSGKKLDCVCDGGSKGYWGFEHKDFYVNAAVPAFGYTTVVLDEAPVEALPVPGFFASRYIEYPSSKIVLENSLVRAVFDRKNMTLQSFTDKKSGKELLCPGAGFFRFAKESAVKGMTSWKEGEILSDVNLNEACDVQVGGSMFSPVRKSVSYSLSFGSGSTLSVTVSLDEGKSALEYDVSLTYKEIGNGQVIPRVDVVFPHGYKAKAYRYDIPFGTIDREAHPFDVPAGAFGAALPEEGPTAVLLSEGKYGFKGNGEALSLTLVRASKDPDPLPEFGGHKFRFAIGTVDSPDYSSLYGLSEAFLCPTVVCPARRGKGTLETEGRFLSAKNALISAVKTSENGEYTVLRLASVSEKEEKFEVVFAKEVKEAYVSDLLENPTGKLTVKGKKVSGKIAPFAPMTVLIKS